MRNELKYFLSLFWTIPKRVNNKEVIVSLASWRLRYRFLPAVLDSLLKQRFQVDRILLWLDREDQEKVPREVMAYKKKGLEIRFTENIGSYKKLIPELKEFPNAIIITAADDVIYPPDFTANLYRSYSKHQDKIHANRCRELRKDKDGKWMPYQGLIIVEELSERVEDNLLFTGVGGVLYPGRDVFYQDVCESNLFLKLAPKQDDLWFWYMARLKGTKVCKIPNNFIPSQTDICEEAQRVGLWENYNSKNPDYSLKDIVLKNLSDFYGYI